MTLRLFSNISYNTSGVVDREVGFSEWVVGAQTRIDVFVLCVGETQWTYVNAEHGDRVCPYVCRHDRAWNAEHPTHWPKAERPLARVKPTNECPLKRLGERLFMLRLVRRLPLCADA